MPSTAVSPPGSAPTSGALTRTAASSVAPRAQGRARFPDLRAAIDRSSGLLPMETLRAVGRNRNALRRDRDARRGRARRCELERGAGLGFERVERRLETRALRFEPSGVELTR